jgi:hypothetical protein
MTVLNESQLLSVHYIDPPQGCTLTDNRFIDPMSKYFCWRGIISNDGETCTAGEVCDPVSFLYARNRFCQRFGGRKIDPRNPGGNPTCATDMFVPNLDSSPVQNIRGGTIINDSVMMCQGPAGWFHCLGAGIQQGISGNKTQLLTHTAIALGGILAIAVVLRMTGVGKNLVPKGTFNTKFLKK